MRASCSDDCEWGTGKPQTDLLPLGEKSWLNGRILGVAKVDQTNADKAKTLPWVQADTVSIGR